MRTPLKNAGIILLMVLAMTLLLAGCSPYHYHHFPNAVTYPAPIWGPEIPYPHQCNAYYPGSREQLACERGARQRMMEEQRRRENEAYRLGRGH